MITTQHPTPILAQHSAHLRCLRHHVSMAACEDCRSARTARIRQARQAGGSALL